MSVFLELPTDICRYLLVEWLELPDLGKLDVAITHPRQRREYQSLLTELLGIGNISEKAAESVSFYEWIYRRAIKLVELQISERLYDDCGSLIVPIALQHVTDVCLLSRVSVIVSQAMNDLLASCKLLRSVRLVNVSAESLHIAALSRLQRLSMNSELNAAVVLNKISQHCRSLTSLVLEFDCCDYKAELRNILRFNSGLKSITLSCLQSCLFAIALHCPSIDDVVLNVPSPVEMISIDYLLELRPTIHRIFVVSSFNSLSYSIDANGKTLKLLQDSQVFDEDTLSLLLQRVGAVVFLHYSGPRPKEIMEQHCVVNWVRSCGGHYKQLTLAKIHVAQIESLLSWCPKLTHLTVSTTSDLTSILPPYSLYLKHLTYTGCNVSLTDLRVLLKVCFKLEYGKFDIKVTVAEDEGGTWISEISKAAKHIGMLELIRNLVNPIYNSPRFVFRFGVHCIE